MVALTEPVCSMRRKCLHINHNHYNKTEQHEKEN